MDVTQRLDAIDERLRVIEERLAIREAPPPEPLRVSAPPRENVLSLTGRAVLILGGAFLLRAATESTTLPSQTGIALGLAYAIAWIVLAARAARNGQRTQAAFHCAVAAIVAYPIIWEATTRFHVLSAITASILLVIVSVAFIAVARLYALESPAWIAVAGATLDALLLAYATKELIPFALGLTVAGVIAFLLSMTYVGWLLAIESDLFAIFLLAAAVLDQSQENRSAVVITLLVFAILWMAVTSAATAQAAAASLIGIGATSTLVLSPLAMTILCGVAAVIAAEIARRRSWLVFAWQSAAWGIIAAIGGGLFTFAAAVMIGDGRAIPIAALIASVFCLAAFVRLESIRLPLLAIAAIGIAAIAIHFGTMMFAGGAAVVRTIILCAAAVVLASIARRWRMAESSQLAVGTLIVAGVQVIAQELRSGSPAIMFIALAIYGSAMLAIARLRSVATA